MGWRQKYGGLRSDRARQPGKPFKGLTDAMLMEQTELLQRLETARDEHTVYVRPEEVEVAFNASPQYRPGETVPARQARGTGGHSRKRARDLGRREC